MATIAGSCGALLLGGLVAFSLSGCVNMQFAMYWRVYPKDTWRTKGLVTLTWVVDISHSVVIAMGLWDSIISPNGNFSAEQLNKIPWSIAIAAELGVVMTFLSQSYFAHRIYILQKRWLVAAPVATISFCRLVAATVSVSQLIELGQYSLLLRPFPAWVITLGLALSVFVDAVITSWLCRFFRRTRKGRFSMTTQRILDTLTVWTMRNGLITSAGAAASLICWLTVPHTLTFLGLHFVMGKFYANSLLATINSRERIRRPHLYDTSAATNPPVIFPQDFGMDVSENPLVNSSARPKGGYPIQVNVERSIVSIVEEDTNATERIYHLKNRDQKQATSV